MNKEMRDLQAQILEKTAAAKALMEGDANDLAKAEALLNEADALQKKLDLLARVETMKKGEVPDNMEPVEEKGAEPKKAADGFKVIAKMLGKKQLTETEKALVSGENAADGENLLIPEDVKLEINELRKTYISAKSLVTVEQTDSLTGSTNWEDGSPAGLAEFSDGGTVTEETNPKFVRKTFTIGFWGKLIPISRILQGSEKAGLMGYINRWFLRNAIITENAKIFATLKAGYNKGVPKVVTGWKALKKSINKDLDPSCLIGAVIVTNQSGFAALDEEEDADGRPILQANPAHPTEKLFQGLPVKVYPDAQLPNVDASTFPLIYGDTKAGATFVEHTGLQFDVSEHFLFNKNQNCLRVLEGFDVMSTDTTAYIYGSFKATPTAATA